MKLSLGAVAVLGLVAGLVATDDARACENGVVYRTDIAVQEIAQAEQQAAAGKELRAAQTVLKHFARIKTLRMGASSLGDRALRTMALAIVRTRGTLHVGSLFPGQTDAERANNQKWAVHVLTGFSLKKPDDARTTTDAAEAFAQIPAKRGDARRMLTYLESKDVVASPQGYAALAELRDNAGEGRPSFVRQPLRALESARAKIARARCQQMAKSAEVCSSAPKTSAGT